MFLAFTEWETAKRVLCVLGTEIPQSLFTDLTPFLRCLSKLWGWDDVKILSCPLAPCKVTPETVLFPWKSKPALWSCLILPAHNRQHTWGLWRGLSLLGNFTPCDYTDPETQTYKWASWALQRQAQPGNNAEKSHNSSWQMNSCLLEGTTWWTMQALAFSAHWHWGLQREIDIITRHNQNDNIMQHLQLIFTFQSLERLLCHNSLVSKTNLARQLLWFSLESRRVKKVRKLL